MEAYNYKEIGLTHIYKVSGYGRKKKRKAVPIKPADLEKKARALVKAIGAKQGIMHNGMIEVIDGSTTYSLNPAFFGVSLDCKDNQIIYFSDNKEKGLNYKNIVPVLKNSGFNGRILLAGDYWSDGHFIFRGDVPFVPAGIRAKEEEQPGILSFLDQSPIDREKMAWSKMQETGDCCIFNNEVYLDNRFVKFVESNTKGSLFVRYRDNCSPFFIYDSKDNILAVIMPLVGEDQIERYPHKPARKGC